ncbi:hypothetical protein O6H91_04G125900 [Diphasiastrum complanatum]|uniref:Uncharacterized protein n=1 Tax=Diphasiastrum complanatum TaxID=34168 RepID=A0ACC2E1K0_DIPCM|nr:hypothetical protein O6H91_04G125900 [Diphasiastrum complanatum]
MPILTALKKLAVKLSKLNHPLRTLSGRSSSSSSTRSTSSSAYLSDREDDLEAAAAADVPQGHLGLYVGREKQRFVVKVDYLNHGVFRALLDKAAEEFGFEHQGALVIPCEVELFEHLLWMLDCNHPVAQQLELNDLLTFYST